MLIFAFSDSLRRNAYKNTLVFFDVFIIKYNHESNYNGELRFHFLMGDTCTPVADSCQCMSETTTIL